MGDVGARDLPEVVVFNKADLIDESARLVLHGLEPRAVFVSSHTGEGIDELRRIVEETLPLPAVEVRVVVPYDRGDLVSAVHETGQLLERRHQTDGTFVHARVSPRLAADLEAFQHQVQQLRPRGGQARSTGLTPGVSNPST